MLPFWSGEYQTASLLQLYRDLYKPGKYRELWFLWNGKPLVHACPDLLRERANSEKTPPQDRRDLAEILEFFTFRPLQPAYAAGPASPDQWCWLEVCPQHPCGVRPQRSASQGPVFRDAIGDVDRRDAGGYGTMHYTDDTGRNDIVECFVSHDAGFVEFAAECAAPVTPCTDAAWMCLFISTRLDADDPTPHWDHIHFVVNRVTPPDGRTAILERCKGGWRWEEAGRVEMKVEGRRVSVRIPRTAIGQGDKVDVRFKWADNTPGDDGNILDFYRHGDAAPDGRFLYHYFE